MWCEPDDQPGRTLYMKPCVRRRKLRSSAAAALYTWSSVAGLAGADTAGLGVRSVQNCQAAAH